jgi:hypothetical protein
MNLRTVITSSLLCFFLIIGIGAKAQEKSVYLFSFKHLKESVSHEFLLSPFLHHAKSPHLANYYVNGGSLIYPMPVYNRVYGIITATYQPKLRLVEFGSKASIALRIPMTFSLSAVDLKTKEGNKYTPSSVVNYNINYGYYEGSRDNALGAFNTEIGGLLGVDFGKDATIENESKTGLSLAAGYNIIYAPLILRKYDNEPRSAYKGLLSWGSLIGQVGIIKKGFSIYYAFGLNPTRVHYDDALGIESTVRTNTYQRLAIGFKLGK